MELRQLRYFLAVAQELHFGRAAERVHIAQSPLSRQIKQLEEELGAPLFIRNKHRVELSEAGKALIPEAESILSATGRIRNTILRAQEGMIGKLIIGYTNSAIYSDLPRILMVYRHKFPLVEIVLRDNLLTPTQIEELDERRIDIGVLRPPTRSPNIELLTITRERLIVALPTSHPLANQKQIDLSLLKGDGFICFSRSLDSALQTQIFRSCQDAGFSAQVIQEVGDIPSMLMLVSSGMGVALVPASAKNMKFKGITFRSLAGGGPQLELALAWNRDQHSTLVDGFIKTTRETLGCP
jgi:DNA-binding transcriptional LysR family regulator